MSEEKRLSVEVELLRNYEFRVNFNHDGVETLIMDELPPVGEEKGLDTSRLILAAMRNYLSASLSFCLRKSRVEVRAREGILVELLLSVCL